jgi:non-ribosomal peptide synthetase component F
VPIDPQLPARRRQILERQLTLGEAHEDGAYVFFTSGSTGTPKPVLGSAAALRHFLDWQVAEFGIGATDRVAFLTALSFDVMVRDLMLPLWAGGTLVIPAPGEADEPEAVVAWLARRRISVVNVVPSVARSAPFPLPAERGAGQCRVQRGRGGAADRRARRAAGADGARHRRGAPRGAPDHLRR